MTRADTRPVVRPVGQSGTVYAALSSLAGAVGEAVRWLDPGDDGPFLLDSIDTIRRLRAEAPNRRAVVVITGGTGTGKSSLLNALAGASISETGLVRPTTKQPVVWCEASYHPVRSGTAVLIEGEDPLLSAVILVDTPDVDSTRESHREMALSLLCQADVCVFVTSAKRYADLAGWSALRMVRRLGVPVYHVMNRLPPEGVDEILGDYARLLAGRRLLDRAESPRLLLIPEQQEGPVSASSVSPLRRYLESLGRAEVRRRVTERSQQGRARYVEVESLRLAARIERRSKRAMSLARAPTAAFDVAVEKLQGELRRGVSDVEALLIGIGETAQVATFVAWTAAGWTPPPADSDLQEQARKAVAEWVGARPEDRSAGALSAVLEREAARLQQLAASTGPPPGMADRLRALAEEVGALA